MLRLIITLGLLGGLLYGADYGARAWAQNQVAAEISQEMPVDAHHPQVVIGGFSFLYQGLRGQYDHVTVHQRDGGHTLRADLYDVELSVGDVLANRTRDLAIGHARVGIALSLAELQRLFGDPSLTLSAGDLPGMIRVETTTTIGGHTYPVTAQMSVSTSANQLTLTAESIDSGSAGLPDDIQNSLRSSLNASMPLDALPFSLESATVEFVDNELVITIEKSATTLSDLPFGQ